MQKIDRDRLDENTGQIECGEEIGTVFLIDKETAITVKHCLLIEKPETYAKNAVLHFSVKDEEKTVKATVISEDNDSSEDLVVLRCEESIDVQPLYLVSAELDVFDELQMVGYGKSFGFEKRWIQLKNTNLLKKPNKNMILDTIDSAAMDYEGFSGSLIADYNNCIVGIANMQNVEKGKANSLLGISVKNRKKFFENNNIPVYDRAALLNVRCKETKAKAFQNGIDQNVYLKNKQLENDTNSRNIEENTNPLLNMSNVYSEDYNWNIKYTRIEGLLGNSNKRRKERKELTKRWAKEFEQYPGWLIVPADFRQQVKSYTNGKELLQCSEKELESNFDYCNELLDFAYEYTRRYKKSCLPLDKNIKNNLYKIWDTLNSHSDWKEKNKNKWFTVGLYLLENYRQNMDEEKWNSICDLLKPCTNFIVDGKYYLKLEEILMNLFKMDLEKVQLELVSCSLEEMPYEVRLRFIGVMTECGLNEEALKAVEELTNDIQKNNNEIAESSPQNVYLKSLLVCALYLKEHLLFCMNPYKEETRKKCNEINNEISKYKKYYNWDKEKILFTDGALTWLKKESPEPEFELNRESITLVRSENNCWEAYSVFKSIEYSGFPLYLRSKSLLNNQQDILVKSLLSYYPQYTWQLLLRLGKADVVKKCITREYLQSKNRKEIDELFEYVYNAIMNNIGKFQKYDPWYDQNIYTSIVASGIPILERMCAVLDYVQQGKMIDLMIRLIEENAVKDQRLLNQFISSVMNQTADYIKRTKINALLTCSMKKRENILGVVQLDPFDVFTEYELSNPLYRKAHLEPKIIKAIFNIGKQQKINRTSVLARMGQLYTWGKLTKEQEVAFGELLWSKLNEDTQLPDLEQYYFFVFMKWPHPEEIDPLKRIKKSFISEKVSSKWKEDIRGRNFTEISYWEQLAVWNRYYVDEWSAKEKKWFLELFIGCCSDMVKYWKESKYDFQFTFSKWHMKMMIRAIASFDRNGWKGTNPVQSKKLCTLLKEFYDEGIYSWEVEAMFLADEKVPAFMNEMLELMYETESDMVFSATMAVEKCLETIMDQQLKENTLLELFNLIKARKEPGLEYFLMIIHNIFYRTNSRFPSKIMKGVSQVLRLVEKYTRINFQTSTQEEFKENIKVRKQCATLAFLIYRFENTFYEGQHCPEVEEWKNICTGEKAENEFAEVKNCWLLPEL